MKNKKLPLKAFIIAVLIAAAHLLSPSSAEAIPVPPSLTTRDIANVQNDINQRTMSDRDTDPLQWATRVKENMFRGDGVIIRSELDIHLDERGRIIGKDTRTRASQGDFGAVSRVISREFGDLNLLRRTRMFTIHSENGIVEKEDAGHYNHR